MISKFKIGKPVFFDLVFLGWSNFLLFLHVRNFVEAGFIESLMLSVNNPENLVSILLAILSLTLMIANNLIFFAFLTDRSKPGENIESVLEQIIFFLPIYLIFWMVNTIIINQSPQRASVVGTADITEIGLIILVVSLLLVPAIAFFFIWSAPERRAELNRLDENRRREKERIKKQQKEEDRMRALQKARKIREINEIYGKKIADAYEKNSIAIDMPLSLVEEIMGPGYEKKETVSKVCEKASYKFGKFTGSRGGVYYEKKIDFENGLCVGWKDL